MKKKSPGRFMGAHLACAYPRCSTYLFTLSGYSGRGAFHIREASQFAGESGGNSPLPLPGSLPSVSANKLGLGGWHFPDAISGISVRPWHGADKTFTPVFLLLVDP